MDTFRILAIDLRSQGFGFAVFEGPTQLLDYGMKSCLLRSPDKLSTVLRKRIASLLTLYVPSVLVIKEMSKARLALPGRRDAMETIRQELRARGITIIYLKKEEIQQAFRQCGKPSRHNIAVFIAGLFPAIRWKLPPYRKNWQPEHYNVAIFGAISLGLAYLAIHRAALPANSRSQHRISTE